MILRHSKLFEGYVVYLGEDPIWASKGRPPSRRGGDGFQELYLLLKLMTTYLFIEGSSSQIGIGYPYALGESEGRVFVVHPGSVAARIKERKCKTMGGSAGPPIKRRLAFGSSRSRVVRAKNSASKDDAPFLPISDDDEGLPDCFKLKDASVCHLKIADINPLAWKGYLDNQMDLKLLDLHDRCYARQAVVVMQVNRRALRVFGLLRGRISGEADVIKARERSREEECKGLRPKCEAAMAEFDQNPTVWKTRRGVE
ncbi:hypothetical protein Tco_0719478 [Tanacetum coccineum]